MRGGHQGLQRGTLHARHGNVHHDGDAKGAGLARHRANADLAGDGHLGRQHLLWRAATAFIAPMKQAE